MSEGSCTALHHQTGLHPTLKSEVKPQTDVNVLTDKETEGPKLKEN